MKKERYFELLFWISSILALTLSYPIKYTYSLCPLAALELKWCPGCGLGRSISCLLHGDIVNSFQYHWFGIPALLILLHRIFVLGKDIVYLSPKDY